MHSVTHLSCLLHQLQPPSALAQAVQHNAQVVAGSSRVGVSGAQRAALTPGHIRAHAVLKGTLRKGVGVGVGVGTNNRRQQVHASVGPPRQVAGVQAITHPHACHKLSLPYCTVSAVLSLH